MQTTKPTSSLDLTWTEFFCEEVLNPVGDAVLGILDRDVRSNSARNGCFQPDEGNNKEIMCTRSLFDDTTTIATNNYNDEFNARGVKALKFMRKPIFIAIATLLLTAITAAIIFSTNTKNENNNKGAAVMSTLNLDDIPNPTTMPTRSSAVFEDSRTSDDTTTLIVDSKSPTIIPRESPDLTSVSPTSVPHTKTGTAVEVLDTAKVPTQEPSMKSLFNLYPTAYIPETSAPLTKPQLSLPTKAPGENTTKNPEVIPANKPTVNLAKSPTANTTMKPTQNPTVRPAKTLLSSPTKNPTSGLTTSSTQSPTANPASSPTLNPTPSPTVNPTKNPTMGPTVSPTKNPTVGPTVSRTENLPSNITSETRASDYVSTFNTMECRSKLSRQFIFYRDELSIYVFSVATQELLSHSQSDTNHDELQSLILQSNGNILVDELPGFYELPSNIIQIYTHYACEYVNKNDNIGNLCRKENSLFKQFPKRTRIPFNIMGETEKDDIIMELCVIITYNWSQVMENAARYYFGRLNGCK